MRIATLSLLLLSSSLALAGPPPGTEAIEIQSVTTAVNHLASDALEGRGSGAAGGRKAGDWLASQLKALGISPGGDNGTYFQGFQGQGQSMRNVVGTIPGTTPGEMIVIGAHYDHLGLGHQSGSLDFGRSRGQVHNGADDNASGTAAVLEVARAFVASGVKPKRRVAFVWFDGEERGLLGSNHYVAHPPFSETTTLMINLDMVGKLGAKPLKIYGATTGGPVLKAWLEQAAGDLSIALDLKDSTTSASDHAPFYKQKIPVVVPFTGLHGDYHRPSDDVEGVDMAGIAKIARFSYGVAYRAVGASEDLAFVKARDGTMETMMEQLQAMLGGDGEGLKGLFGGRNGEGGLDLGKLFGGGENGEGPDFSRLGERLKGLFGERGGERPRRNRPGRARLGVVLEQGDVLRVKEVREGTVAERAGVRAGDAILSLDGQPVDSLETLRGLLRDARGETSLEVEREGERLVLTADFGGARRPKPQPKPPVVKKEPRWF